jgi:hypothetical protein
VVSCL